MNDLLAIVPARKDSKGVPGKALRTVGGIPMILRTLRTVEAAGVAERIVVSTNDPEIESFCRLRGYEVQRRPSELGADDVPLMDVAEYVTEQLEWHGPTAIFQPTCPLLRPETVRSVVLDFDERELDWAITAYRDPHIHWRADTPLTERGQRQQLHDVTCESGAIQFMRSMPNDCYKRGVIEIPAREALDVDTPDDLMLAERLCSLRQIHFVVLMGDRVGTGHFHRSKLLAESLSHHDISWDWTGDPPDWAREQITYPDAPSVGLADLVILDCLGDVSEAEILDARAAGVKVITLEDESATKHVADLTVNDLLDPADLQYAVIRAEFLHMPVRHPAHRRVLVTFGGTDPAQLGDRCTEALAEMGCDVHQVTPGQNIRMAEAMHGSEVVLTSQGRTVLEAAVCGTPCISIAANERENRHVRISGVTYLGMHSTVTDDQIRHAVSTTLSDVHLQRENAAAAHAAVDGRGLDRLVRRIEDVIL